MATYAANHPHSKPIVADISTVQPGDLVACANGRSIDLVAGGPSCQGYSTHGKRIEDDPRNFLFKHFVRLVQEVRPKFFLLENVKGMLTYRKGHFREVIREAFEKAGYTVGTHVLLAADYGVPQLRERIIFLGSREPGAELSFPEPTHGTTAGGDIKAHVTVKEAIGDLPEVGNRWNIPITEYATKPRSAFQEYARANSTDLPVSHHIGKPPSAAALEIISKVGQGEGLRSLPPHLLPKRFKQMRRIKNGQLRRDCTTLYYRLAWGKPSYTITCYFPNVSSGPFVHPSENRSLTYREAARLMSFTDDYQFLGGHIARQIGNAVPPLMAKAIGEHIMKLLSGSKKASAKRSPRLLFA